jgi:hypothetical protein
MNRTLRLDQADPGAANSIDRIAGLVEFPHYLMNRFPPNHPVDGLINPSRGLPRGLIADFLIRLRCTQGRSFRGSSLRHQPQKRQNWTFLGYTRGSVTCQISE